MFFFALFCEGNGVWIADFPFDSLFWHRFIFIFVWLYEPKQQGGSSLASCPNQNPYPWYADERIAGAL